MRLSRDDEKAGESMSIEHQRIILHKFVGERGGKIVSEYVDDGYSGTDFDRPGVKRMLEDAKSGKINTIVVKDLSRFGRNYIQVGQYVDYIFPAYGIRFIAINDNVDTADRCSTAMDMMPIMNVFNEWHAANTSKKIRAVLDASRRSGKYTSSVYPYGYKAGTDENRTAYIDEVAANTVRRIFELRAEGNSVQKIARILTDMGIPNPATYFTRLDGKKLDKKFSPYWCPSTVMGILNNPTYLGNTVQHKTTSVSYKNHKVLNVPESEYIVKENAHEAIISRELWDRVQTMNNSVSRGRTDRKDIVHALSGLLICADCGKKLKLKNSEKAGAYFVCRTYADLGKRYCSSHSISETALEHLVLRDIKSMLTCAGFDSEKARENFVKERAKRDGQNRNSREQQLKEYRGRLGELQTLTQAAFEEKVLNNLPESVFLSLCKKYQNEIAALEKQISNIERLQAETADDGEAEKYMKKLKSYVNCEKLTREMCLQLVNFITVGEKTSPDISRKIHIYYNFSAP